MTKQYKDMTKEELLAEQKTLMERYNEFKEWKDMISQKKILKFFKIIL